MQFSSFRIKNFKGIVDTTISLGKNSPSVHTLVGLNESGKTTVLEAINLFQPDVDGMHVVAQREMVRTGNEQLIPKSKRADFTGDIELIATVELSEPDRSSIHAHIKQKFNADLDPTSILPSFQIKKFLRFENSKFKNEGSLWYLSPSIKRKGKRNFEACHFQSEEWKSLVVFIRQKLPRIIYFPNFLFQFPDKILISGQPHGATEAQIKTNQYFVDVIRDAMSSLTPPLDLAKHIVDRVIANKPESTFAQFMQIWFGSPESESLEAVQERLSRKVSDEVFGRWKSVLGRELEDTQIEIKNVIEFNEATGSREVYLTFRVRQGGSRYNISERSLGFRWFFCFLLFTRFSAATNDAKNVVFLLDEPASNLHSKAQAKLLDSFEVIAGGKNTLIYSTHSHHLINPLWLENAHVVSNGVDLDSDLDGSISSSLGEISITVQPYKRFVGENAEKSHYFQPILDRLDYAPSKLEVTNGGVIVEGKSDYYILNWFKKYYAPNCGLDFVPVGGASNARALLSLYLGWCKRYVFLLDNDGEGQSAKKHYVEELPVSDSNFVLFSDVFGDKKGSPKEIEELLSKEVKDQVAAMFSVSRPTKTHIQRAFASSLYGNETIALDAETKAAIEKLLQFLKIRLESDQA